MAELRWHPLTKDWVMIASNRQGRPQMPKDWCPFCPSGGKVPDYDVLEYDNDFPALSQNPPVPDDVANDFFKTAPSYGKCEVILYSPEHTKTLKELPQEHVEKLVHLWQERFRVLSSDEKIKFIFIFENRGDVVGVTMPHPHGQIYGYSFIPTGFNLLSSATKSNRYNEISEQIDHRTNGYKFRKESMMHKTDAAILFIKNALRLITFLWIYGLPQNQ